MSTEELSKNSREMLNDSLKTMEPKEFEKFIFSKQGEEMVRDGYPPTQHRPAIWVQKFLKEESQRYHFNVAARKKSK